MPVFQPARWRVTQRQRRRWRKRQHLRRSLGKVEASHRGVAAHRGLRGEEEKTQRDPLLRAHRPPFEYFAFCFPLKPPHSASAALVGYCAAHASEWWRGREPPQNGASVRTVHRCGRFVPSARLVAWPLIHRCVRKRRAEVGQAREGRRVRNTRRAGKNKGGCLCGGYKKKNMSKRSPFKENEGRHRQHDDGSAREMEGWGKLAGPTGDSQLGTWCRVRHHGDSRRCMLPSQSRGILNPTRSLGQYTGAVRSRLGQYDRSEWL